MTPGLKGIAIPGRGKKENASKAAAQAALSTTFRNRTGSRLVFDILNISVFVKGRGRYQRYGSYAESQ